ncbi:hypothetical protein PQZ52_02945, partial [Flavobacteriales bacterium]|nr:hypothetical protein [Flavobacteriales bacterium]
YHHIAIPLVNSQIGIDELLKRDTIGLVTTATNGGIEIAYESSSISVSASEIIDIPNQSFSESFSPPVIPIFQVGEDTTFSAQIIKPFSLGNKKLDTISFSYGELRVKITNNLRHDVEVVINIPSLVRKNTSSVFFYNQNTDVGQNSSKDTLVDLGNYNLDLTQGFPLGGLGYNELIIDYSVKIIGSGAPIASNDDLKIDFTLENLEFARIDGDFKYIKETLDSSLLTLAIFNLSDSSLDFSLTNPTIKHTIVNSFGFDISLGMEEMYYEDLSGNFIDSIRYNSSGPGSSQTSAPFNFLPSITQSTTDSIIMDSTNSNIGQLINATPKTIISKPFIEINPDTTISNNNYIESSSEISVSTEITLPLVGYAKGWVMKDTIPFNAKVDELFSSETSIDSAIIKFTTTNYFPLDVILDLILLDSTGLNPIDTIASNKLIIESGVIDANGKITTAQAKLTTIPCDGTCVDNLNNTRFIVLRLSIGTTGVGAGQSVKIYEDYNIELDISLSISGRMF